MNKKISTTEEAQTKIESFKEDLNKTFNKIAKLSDDWDIEVYIELPNGNSLIHKPDPQWEPSGCEWEESNPYYEGVDYGWIED